MTNGRSLGDVDARRPPTLSGLGERRHDFGRFPEAAETRHAHAGELASDPPLTCERVSSGREGTGVTVRALAAAEPVLDEVADLASARLAPFDPGTRHGR